ncbi:site-specific recombinase [Chryseobacterium sp. StRB126]|nr:site-specific recombinase [Chryseobacterium sp. StRB126]
MIKKQCKQKIESLENELHSCLLSNRNREKVDGRLDKALSLIGNLSLLYQSSSIEVKRKIISSIYPENLQFTGMEYRAARVNSILHIISLINSDLTVCNDVKKDKKRADPCVWPHQESNLDLKFRKLLFYPLNYEAYEKIKIQIILLNN